jgi:hypothetical protein
LNVLQRLLPENNKNHLNTPVLNNNYLYLSSFFHFIRRKLLSKSNQRINYWLVLSKAGMISTYPFVVSIISSLITHTATYSTHNSTQKISKRKEKLCNCLDLGSSNVETFKRTTPTFNNILIQQIIM